MDDEDHYWNDWSEPRENPSKFIEDKRSKESSTLGRVKPISSHKAPDSSPLLKEYMEKNGIEY